MECEMNEPARPGTDDRGLQISYPVLHGFCAEALRRAGLSESDAATGADVLATTDAWGVHTHGSKILRSYLPRLIAGGLKPNGRPRIASEGGAWAIVDADRSLGMVGSSFAMEVAIRKARDHGIGYVGVRNSSHFGAAGYYAWMAAREGLIGVSMANDRPSVAAPGSRGAVTGSNPVAYAIPAGRLPPILLDMSIATVAGGKVFAARERGEQIPEGWLIGPDGRPTTDPSLYPALGSLTPAAGHKGYGIALLIEALSGILTGAAFTWRVGAWMTAEPTAPTDHGGAFLAFDAAAMMPSATFGRRMEELIDEIHAAPRADEVERILVPGELEWERHRRAMAAGILLPPDVVASLREAASIVDLDLDRYAA
jgi:ureidoglycolate dehydrogenase (NAD+)